MSKKQSNPEPPAGAVKPTPPPEPPFGSDGPERFADPVVRYTKNHATGKYDRMIEADAPDHFGGAMNAGLTPRQKPQPVKVAELLQQIKGIAILENDRKQNVALDAIITLIRKWQRE